MLHFYLNLHPHFEIWAMHMYVVGKEEGQVVGVGVLAAFTELVGWESQNKIRWQLAAGLTWEAGGIPHQAAAFSVWLFLCGAAHAPCCWVCDGLGQKPASSKPSWGSSFVSVTSAGCGEGKTMCRLSSSHSHFGTSDITATVMLPQHGNFHPKVDGRQRWGVPGVP